MRSVFHIRVMAVAVAVAVVASGCAGSGADTNSLEYEAGYSDGCATGGARGDRIAQEPQRDAELYEKSGDYRAGWAAGYNVCGPSGRSGRL